MTNITTHNSSIQPRFIISGGGTGGHIFPALSIANAIREKWPQAAILFVGAENRMEMERVPAAGYEIVGLPVAGFNRKQLHKNVSVGIKLIKSLRRAKEIVKSFRPDVVIGVGGYASAPVLRAAVSQKIPTLLQEQNSLAGMANKWLGKKASTICVAYEGMDRFFPKDRIVLTGNPCRQDLTITPNTILEGNRFFNLDPAKKTILMLGGSLGARTLNDSIVRAFPEIEKSKIQIIWQCGKYYYDEMMELSIAGKIPPNVLLFDFVSRMDLAYSVADLVISRAGAGSISEFSILGKPVILVPSPNVAEDHQTQNAMALVQENAAILVADDTAPNQLFSVALNLVNNQTKLMELSANIMRFAQHNSADRIVDEISKLINIKK
ncbi:MAG TPA: undecaprenyldiphospho-muramoylpentapeptide beta-N-acetylglucosaminyltransferase [Dysgonamonadaceae bacterium]|nr:undecaprenyldiphospho-muramoylpentapeptide beta-N-acetylglucosaminyltransferase [Dysgonamonadaceae bacterium]